jgi:hypothetical protein
MTDKQNIPFEKWNEGGICDVCNGPLEKGKAYKVPVDVFYGSKKYKEWLKTSPMMELIIMAGGGGVDEFILRARARDKSAHSAVCQDCIHMFI